MNKSFFTLIALVILGVVGCAEHKVAEDKVESEIKTTEAPKDGAISPSIRDFIMKSESLNAEQKKKLLDIQDKAKVETDSLKEEITKAKLVLAKTVLSPEMKLTEYRMLKKKIIALEKQRIELGFKAIDEVREVINPKDDEPKKEIYQRILNTHIQDND